MLVQRFKQELVLQIFYNELSPTCEDDSMDCKNNLISIIKLGRGVNKMRWVEYSQKYLNWGWLINIAVLEKLNIVIK